MLIKNYYNTILSASFSPCSTYLLAGNVFGDIRLFNMKNLANSVEEDLIAECPAISKNCHDFILNYGEPISCTLSTDKFFIAGIGCNIYGWLWNDVRSIANGNSPPKSAWKIPIPQSHENVEVKTDVNCIKYEDGLDGVLFAGCSDGKIRIFSLEDGRCLKTFCGHPEFIHCLDIRENTFISGSEDGTIKIWDYRQGEVTNTVSPFLNNAISRPSLGNWIGDVSLNEDWMVCGGGPRLSLWNLRNMDCPMTVFNNTNDDGIFISKFYQDKIFTGGSASYLGVLSYNDELITGIESSSSTLYCCAMTSQHEITKMLCVTGSSNNIDVSTNFSYREFKIPFY